MKKILVLSDSHGNVSRVEEMVKLEGPLDAVIFSGDGLKDFGFIEFEGNPRKLFVPGNCDGYHPVYDSDIIKEELFGRIVLVFHGHRHNVKQDESFAADLCREMMADVCVFGHTHDQYVKDSEGILLINPGSAALGEYAVITAERDRWSVDLKK